ncbi:hypothetical protein L195_g054812 [Trifolium pratense]|uniref:Uncharacterized protein n=1 Tax=Trifolium pratense TaxID=57577 RepID=A0A2K3KI59_TRIPR|nr:hypothetical protein L195_g054812 [Trifolium pratense]
MCCCYDHFDIIMTLMVDSFWHSNPLSLQCTVNQFHGCYQNVSNSSIISSGGEVKACWSVVKLQRKVLSVGAEFHRVAVAARVSRGFSKARCEVLDFARVHLAPACYAEIDCSQYC